jgi:hypothetical protein
MGIKSKRYFKLGDELNNIGSNNNVEVLNNNRKFKILALNNNPRKIEY